MQSVWANILWQLLKETRISQRELARRSGVNRSAVRRIMAGLNAPSLVHLEKMMVVFGYEIDAVSVKPADKSPAINCTDGTP
jgi:transcriptional regulator with XRE-family HTH domain